MSVRERLLADIGEILEYARDDISAFRGARFFVTGGTGFVGKWFLWSVLEANRRLALGIRLDVLTRDRAAFIAASPELANDPSVTLIEGDVVAPIAGSGAYDAIVHAATPASAKLIEQDPKLMLDIIIDGGRRVIELAERSGAVPILFTSSGAVYGRQPPGLANVDESYTGSPNPAQAQSAYHEGKRVAELQLAIHARHTGARVGIARLFAFVGPFLPLDQHFAVGNFIRDALAGVPIEIRGDGTPYRSYMYASDMVAWLWAVFARGESCRPYNVGSSEGLDLAAVAGIVAKQVSPGLSPIVRTKAVAGAPAERYVPSTDRIERELSVTRRVTLRDGIARTISWARTNRF